MELQYDWKSYSFLFQGTVLDLLSSSPREKNLSTRVDAGQWEALFKAVQAESCFHEQITSAENAFGNMKKKNPTAHFPDFLFQKKTFSKSKRAYFIRLTDGVSTKEDYLIKLNHHRIESLARVDLSILGLDRQKQLSECVKFLELQSLMQTTGILMTRKLWIELCHAKKSRELFFESLSCETIEMFPKISKLSFNLKGI